MPLLQFWAQWVREQPSSLQLSALLSFWVLPFWLLLLLPEPPLPPMVWQRLPFWPRALPLALQVLTLQAARNEVRVHHLAAMRQNGCLDQFVVEIDLDGFAVLVDQRLEEGDEVLGIEL